MAPPWEKPNSTVRSRDRVAAQFEQTCTQVAYRARDGVPLRREQPIPLTSTGLWMGFGGLEAHHIESLRMLQGQLFAQWLEIVSIGSPAMEHHQTGIHAVR